MTNTDQGESFFQDDIYRQTFAGIRTLRRQLPDGALESLAREVIRRLASHPPADVSSINFPTDADIDELSRALIAKDATAGKTFVSRIRAEGASIETVYLAYLRRAALQLGTWWENDEISFVDVTVATGHIFSIMRGFSHLFVTRNHIRAERSALFATVPGEDHVIGVRMAADLFRKDGWSIDLATDLDHDALVERIVKGGHSVVGLSAAGEHALPNLAQLIVALRISAPQATIFVGGNIVAVSERTVALMGPDGMASAFEEAEAEMSRLCAIAQV